MTISRWMRLSMAATLTLVVTAGRANAQGVTTSAINATVTDESGAPRSNARVVAIHVPSGTHYEGRTGASGRVVLPGMRVGGPYKVTASALGMSPDVRDSVYLQLGVATDLAFRLRTAAVQLGEVTITGATESAFSSQRTGASTAVQRDVLQTLPSITGQIQDFVRLTPQYSGSGFGMSFAGQDNRMNNITVDGAYFNNSFGLAGSPGERTGVAPISMDAIEQIQVTIAPYDVRQGNFIGAGVNTVTRSGTNEWRGSGYYAWRNNQTALHGTQAKGLIVNPGTFKFDKIGANIGGPIMRDKLFFFFSYEDEGLTSPATTFTACPTGAAAGTCGTGNTTRVLQSDLDALSTYLSSNFGYNPGPYQNYNFQTPATRYLGKLDYNLNNRNKVTLRYSQLDSYTDVLLSNSSSLGAGTRRSNTTGLNFSSSNYQILENIKTWVGEVNTVVGNNMANNFVLGYEHHDESRGYKMPCSSFVTSTVDPNCFPFVDILSGGSVYTSLGFEPFTPNNELRYGSYQVQDNFTIYGNQHEWTFGVAGEKYRSENVFFQGAQSVYVYNSLADFYTDLNNFLAVCGTNSSTWASCNRTTSPVTLNRFQVGYANIPGMTKPLQPLDVRYVGAYVQDQWRPNNNLKFTLGLRVDQATFGDNGFQNDSVTKMQFLNDAVVANGPGDSVKYSTKKMPDPKLLISPRLGFNWDVLGDKTFQVRGGTGVFTGRPAYVWISNQIGNNGVITGLDVLTNTTARPFHPDPSHYKPAATGKPAVSYALALTDPEFKFPQLWRTDVGLDKRLPWELIGSTEFLYNRDVNGVYYVNANLPKPDANFVGPDQRPRWNTDKCPTQVINGVNQFTGTQTDRINCAVTSAIVLKNSNKAYGYNVAASLERPFGYGTYAKLGYSYGVQKNYVDPGSIAAGSWQTNPVPTDPNNAPLSYSTNSPGHRFFASGSQRMQIFGFGATTASLFWEFRTIGNSSYIFASDANGDGGFTNDLIYIPKDQTEMYFVPFTQTVNGVAYTFTAQQQADAFEKYIQQDKYLRAHRGQYAQRGAVWLPMFNRADFSLAQEIAGRFVRDRHALQLRLDFLNFGNLLNHNWGVSQRMVNNQILTNPGVDAAGHLTYRLRTVGTPPALIDHTFEQTAGVSDVYRIQLSVRYSFN